LFDQLSDSVNAPTHTELHNAVSEIVVFRRAILLPFEVIGEFAFAKYELLFIVSRLSLTIQSYSFLVSEIEKIDHRMLVYFTAVALLHVAYKITRDSLTDELVDMIVIIYLLATYTSITSEAQLCVCESLQKFMKCIYETPATSCYSSGLVELLQQSAVELLTTFRQIEKRDFGYNIEIVTTDYEALYAYKRGDYQRCLQLSTHNVHTLLKTKFLWPTVITFPEYIQLLDDEVVSLIGLVAIVIADQPHRSIQDYLSLQINPRPLSLYLMTQCQMKLRHSVTSLDQTLDYTEEACRRLLNIHWLALEQLLLKLIKQKIKNYLSENGRT